MLDRPDHQEPPVLARNYMQPFGSKEGVVAPTFAEHAFRPNYVFAGITPYIDGEARARDHQDHSLRSRIHGDWFVAQASNALGNACCQQRKDKAQESIDRAIALREIMSIALAATEAAILETARQLDLTIPDSLIARKPEDKVIPNGPRRLRKSEHPGE